MNDKTLISELTVGEFKSLIQEVIEEKLRVPSYPVNHEEPDENSLFEIPIPDDDPSLPQHVRIKAWLDWYMHIEDDKSPEWWDELDTFLAEHRFKARDVDFGDDLE